MRATIKMSKALIYNFAIGLAINDITYIWAWNVLQTIAISLILAWPLLKTSKILRIIIAAVLLIVNEILLAFLLPYQGEANFYGVLFHILYNPLDQYALLSFFNALLLGTVIGDVLFDLNKLENTVKRAISKEKSLKSFCNKKDIIIIGDKEFQDLTEE